MSCKLCITDLHSFLTIAQRIGKVYSVEGTDITIDFFREMNVLRRTIKKMEE